MAVLQILANGKSRIMELPEGKLILGRSGESDIVIEDSQASRKHCSIEPCGDGYQVCDLASRNGIRVNGARVDQALVLYGEPFYIGKTELRIFPESAPPVEPLNEDTVTAAPAVPVAEFVPDDEPIQQEEGPPSLEQILIEARRDLNNLRTAGADPGFQLNDVALLDCHGKPAHSGKIESGSEAVRALRLLFFGAFRLRATDIHFDPHNVGHQVRFRVDGKMLPVVLLPGSIGRAALSVVKVLAELNIAGRKGILDGSFTVDVGRKVDCRVSLTPTMHGEKLVVRILDTAHIPHTLVELGLPPVMLRQIRQVCHLDAGMMVVSGPTGSGKTTTLYTALKTVDSKSRNVVTIEDPIEYRLDGATQIQVDARNNLTFASILRSVLRQDPDVILVGEMRDAETAQVAMQAAMTGHLVFTTLHARDTIGSIFRLLDLKVEAYMIAHAVSLCLAQRLVRRLCPHCKKPYRPKPSQLVAMHLENANIHELYTHVGCRKCLGVGYWGRSAIFELLGFNDNLRDALMTTRTIHDIRKAAGEWTYQTLLESGYRKVAEGITTQEEVDRVAARE